MKEERAGSPAPSNPPNLLLLAVLHSYRSLKCSSLSWTHTLFLHLSIASSPSEFIQQQLAPLASRTSAPPFTNFNPQRHSRPRQQPHLAPP
ncbi:hypothetical protein FJTKL_13141 [Diaporthe vaccinii]|uniref:Uncharacterized protein n=1 Tax=Diaporthe vaccinii TaxID=105482 RepID=A0ABR4EBF2_9PEZI